MNNELLVWSQNWATTLPVLFIHQSLNSLEKKINEKKFDESLWDFTFKLNISVEKLNRLIWKLTGTPRDKRRAVAWKKCLIR